MAALQVMTRLEQPGRELMVDRLGVQAGPRLDADGVEDRLRARGELLRGPGCGEREVGEVLAQYVAGFVGEPLDAVRDGLVPAHIAVLHSVPRILELVAEALQRLEAQPGGGRQLSAGGVSPR